MKIVARGVHVDLAAWAHIYSVATHRRVGVVRFAGQLLERAAEDLGYEKPAPLPAAMADAWALVPRVARKSVRDSLAADIDTFEEQYDPGDDAFIDTHIAGLRAMVEILDRLEER